MIDRPLVPSCWRCLHVVPAAVKIDKVPYCRKCARELIAKPLDLRIEPVAGKRLALSIALVIALMLGTTVAADEPVRCDEASDGARAGEGLDARIARLELQLRLSKAELAVRRGARR